LRTSETKPASARKEIRADAEERADELVAEAEADAEATLEAAEAEADREIEREREQQLSSAKLEAKQMRLEARRDALEEVRETVRERIAPSTATSATRSPATCSPPPPRTFDEGDDVRVHGRSDDEALISEILDDYDGYEYAGEYDCLGGVVVESEASRVRVNNTFDSVLEDVWENNLKEISTKLFDEDQ
jgi:Archaeal/vacuolar-type H+-ATPase subunit E